MSNEHAWFIDRVETAVTGGLCGDDRDRFERHAGECEACASLLADARAEDRRLVGLFAEVAPSADLEERVIDRLRAASAPSLRIQRRVHPAVRRAAIAAAALICIGATGYLYDRGIRHRGYSAVGYMEVTKGRRVVAASNLRQIGRAALIYADDIHQQFPRSADQASAQRGVENPFTGDNHDNTYTQGESTNAENTLFDHATLSLNTGISTISITHVSNTDVKLADTPVIAGGVYNYNTTTISNAAFTDSLSISSVGQDDQHSAFQSTAGNIGTVTVAGAAYAYTNPQAASGGTISLGTANAFTGNIVVNGGAVVDGTTSGLTKSGDGALTLNNTLTNQRAALDQGTLSLVAAGAIVAAGTPQYYSGNPNEPVHNRQFATAAKLDDVGKDIQKNLSHPIVQPVKGQQSGSPQAAPTTPVSSTPTPATDAMSVRKIIRTGSMDFEVDSFDSAALRLQKIVEEESGFIGATDSDRLANGKVRGSIVVRVPPENLEVLVLKLRGLGDLTSQKITAADVTKQFTDLDSQLRAARAMETRLLAIIKDGKGEVKDLLEAEKELSVWREKIESVEGEMRYINSQVALSTLSITLTERDIKAAAAAFESEQVTLSLESEKVDEEYVKAKDAITEAKGRIIESELKQYEPGQYGAKIVAEVGPAEAEALIGRLRQFPGRVATFNRERKQTTDGGTAAPLGIKIEQRDTRFDITLYNVATIAPRHASSVVLASADVEQSAQQIQSAVSEAGGRMLGSTTTRPNVAQVSSLLRFDVPTEKVPAVLLALHGAGEVSKLETTDNADATNSTTVKQGFAVQILSFAMVLPREVYTRELASNDVGSSYQAILNSAHTLKARVIASSLNQQDRSNITANLDFEIARQDQPALDQAIVLAGETIASNVQRSADGENVINDKIEYKIALVNAERLAPRETTTLGIEAADVEQAMNNIIADAIAAHGRSMESTVSKENDGRETARVIVDVPLDQQRTMLDALNKRGTKRTIESSRNPLVPDGKLARARFDVTLFNPQGLVNNSEGPWTQIREGLSTGLLGLLTAMKYVIIGLFFAIPALFVWSLWRFARRKRHMIKSTSST